MPKFNVYRTVVSVCEIEADDLDTAHSAVEELAEDDFIWAESYEDIEELEDEDNG